MSTATATTVQEPTSTRSSRKASSASAAATASSSKQTKDASRTRERDKDRDREREKDRDTRDREGRERASERERKTERQASGASQIGMGTVVEELQRIPVHDAEPAPPTLMYWSRAPVWGTQPTHKMRSHSATVVDNTMIWMFGGCDDKEFWRDILCLDVGEYPSS